jgi:geranylgeranyl diphosphate synthase type II
MTAASDLVRDVLDDYGALARRALAQYLEQAVKRDAVYQLAADYPLRKGRSLRASLCIAAARAFGATVEEAVRSAVSLELLHSAFLVHDDIEDESEERRGGPTLHRMVGVASALNAGDALITLALRPLLGNRSVLGPLVAWQILEEAERMVRESVEGQAMELRGRRENSGALTESDYLMMILKKTCWYTTLYPTRVGALIGTRGEADLDQFARFGFFLGAAFQIQDDLLNIVGDHARYGKELAGDLFEGKRTLLLIHTLERVDPDERQRVLSLLSLSRAEKPMTEVAWLNETFERVGAVDYATQVAHALAGAAAHEFSVCFAGAVPGRDRDFVGALPHWVLERC